MGREEKQKPKRLTIDLRSGCDFKKSHLKPGLKIAILGYYTLLGLLFVLGAYDIASVAIAKRDIQALKAEEIHSMSQIRELQDLQNKTELQIEEANKLIEWQFGGIHGQRLIHALFSGMSKEVLLEKFSFKQDKKHNHQVSLTVHLKGGYRELHHEFETMLTKLEELGLMLISQNQSEMQGGMRLHLVCQMNFLKNNKR